MGGKAFLLLLQALVKQQVALAEAERRERVILRALDDTVESGQRLSDLLREGNGSQDHAFVALARSDWAHRVNYLKDPPWRSRS